MLSYGSETINLGATLAATVGGLTPGLEYAFTLRAANSGWLAGAAATAAATIPAAAPSAPVGLQASALSLAARLVWQEPAANGAPITNYVVSYGAITANLGVALTTTITGLAAGGEYVFTLRAQNSVGLGLAAVALAFLWRKRGRRPRL